MENGTMPNRHMVDKNQRELHIVLKWQLYNR
jgi:hypothetical protein